MFETKLSGHNQIGGHCPWMPCGYGPGIK